MKRFIILMVFLCFITASCAKKPINNIEVSIPIKTLNYIGSFEDNVSIYRDLGDKLIVQKAQEMGFDIFSLDINEAILKFEYTLIPQDKLLYCKQLDVDRTLKVKQLGNSEENNVLLLEGKVTKNIAKNIAYSQTPLVSTSPNQKYIVYCTVGDVLNQYSMQLYNQETGKTMLLIDTVDEVLLNDMQGNLSWAPNEGYLAISSKQIFNLQSGKLISEINAENVLWSTSGDKLAFTKLDKGFSRSISILDINTTDIEEVFIVNKGEYLPGYIIWNKNETMLAFATSLIDTEDSYNAIYSLDLKSKEAVRIDTALKMEIEQVSKLESMHYNEEGNILVLTMADYLGSYLYVFNMRTSEWELFLNIEYLHYENNEDYVCSAGPCIYFIQGQNIVKLDENMKNKIIYKSEDILEDLYLSKHDNAMIIVEKSKNRIVLRQLVNFVLKSM